MTQRVMTDPSSCPVCGSEACDNPAHLTPARDEETGHRPPRRVPLVFTAAVDLLTEPAPLDVLEGVLQAGRITALVSESGAGKTFVLLNVAAAITSNVRWHGREVLHGSVAYLSYEGDALGLRLRAIRQHQGHRLEHLYILRASDPLSPVLTHEGELRSIGELTVLEALQTLRADLATTGRPPIRLLVVDTIRASLTGSEDHSENAAAYLRVVRRLLGAVPEASGILAHHAGWQDGDSQRKRERGSSAWRGNCDLTLYLEAEDADPTSGLAHLTLRQLKVRDGDRLPPLALLRQRVEMPESTRRGQPVTSCIIDSDRRSREDKDAEAAAVLDQEQTAADLKILRTIADHPVTSQDRLRLLLGGARKETVGEALARLLRKQWVRFPDKQRQPYVVTEAGDRALQTS